MEDQNDYPVAKLYSEGSMEQMSMYQGDGSIIQLLQQIVNSACLQNVSTLLFTYLAFPNYHLEPELGHLELP